MNLPLTYAPLSSPDALRDMNTPCSPRLPVQGFTFAAALQRELEGQTKSINSSDSKRGPRYEFPPAEAPESFKTAWKTATTGMDPGDRMTYEIQIWGRLHPEQSCVGNDETITPLQGDDIASYEGILRNHLESMATRPELYSCDQLRNGNAFYGRLLNLLAQDRG